MCAYMWTWLYGLAKMLFCIKVWCVLVNYDYVQIYQLESSCTVVPSCERNILMQIDTDIILIVLDPKQ